MSELESIWEDQNTALVPSYVRESNHKKRSNKRKRHMELGNSGKSVLSQVNIEIKNFGNKVLRTTVPYGEMRESNIRSKRSGYDNDAVSASHFMHGQCMTSLYLFANSSPSMLPFILSALMMLCMCSC